MDRPPEVSAVTVAEPSLAMPRRPVAIRNIGSVRALGAALARRRVRPNVISSANVMCASLAGASFLAAGRWKGSGAAALYVLAALFIVLRGLCSVLDGLVAVEGGLGSKAGAVWNDLPDRISDPIMLVCAGASIPGAPWGSVLGWLAALLAVQVAYVRVLGGSLGVRQSFDGPMAKQHRMAAVALGALVAAVEVAAGRTPRAVGVALVVVVVGSFLTFVRRTTRVVHSLGTSAQPAGREP